MYLFECIGHADSKHGHADSKHGHADTKHGHDDSKHGHADSKHSNDIQQCLEENNWMGVYTPAMWWHGDTW